MAEHKKTGDIQVASKTAEGEYKPSVFFMGDYQTWWLHHIEGIEGLHTRMSEVLSEKTGKNKLYYLNHGYFKVKPEFTVALNENTSDPQPKKDRNGNFQGVFQVYDVQNNIEGVLWCYTQPNNRALWERLQTQIEFAILRMKEMGIDTVDENGYLPAIFKIGKLPTRMGAKFAKVVSWDTQVEDIQVTQFMSLDHPLARESYSNFPPMFANEYENQEGPTILQTLKY